MNLKKWFIFLLTVIMMMPMFCMTASAAEMPKFRYELTVDGKDVVEVTPGDVITVTLHLYRSDKDEAYTMHAMQDEIRYDSEFFELVDGTTLLSNGIQSTDIALVDHHREFYMNYVSLAGGSKWDSNMRIGTFQLRVIATEGATTVSNQDYLVSLPDGSGSYKCDANDLTVVLTTECTVKFETNGGTPIAPIKAIYGEKIVRPEDPIREGKHLVGWFKDIHLTDEWKFKSDTVTGNMTLYAKWADGDPKTADACIICGRDNTPIPGVPLCWLCLLILLLILLAILLVLIRCKKEMKCGKIQLRITRKEDNKHQGERDEE